MSRSLSQQVDLTCTNCGKPFNVDVWLILDPAERPDVADQIRQGTLHRAVCPECGHKGTVDAPVLVYINPSRILFSPAQQTKSEEDARHATGLLNRLRADGVEQIDLQAVVPVARVNLAVALDRNGAEAGISPAGQDDSGSFDLGQALFDLINAKDWQESREIVSQHPELLQPGIEEMFDLMITQATADGADDVVQILEEHRLLLRRCREDGIEQAFDEKLNGAVLPSVIQTLQSFLQATSWAESQEIVLAHPELLEPGATAFLAKMIERAHKAGAEDAVKVLQQHADLLHQCAASGVEQAFASRLSEQDRFPLFDAINEFIQARNWEESRSVVRAHPELLDESTDRLMEAMMDHARTTGAEDAYRVIDEHRDLLSRCRQIGIEAAFDAKVDAGALPPLYNAIREFVDAPNWPASRDIVAAHPELLEPGAEEMMRAMIQRAHEAGEEDAVRVLEAHLERLLLCRDCGPDAALGMKEE